MDLKEFIRTVPDFPKEGILFYDITTLLQAPKAYSYVIDRMQEYCESKKPTIIAGIESRGFIFAGALADRMKLPFVPIRKAGKLPADTVSLLYDLEYGSSQIEIHVDAVADGDRVIIVDDLIATGGTLAAACDLVTKCGAEVVGVSALIELAFLPWRDKVTNYDINYLVSYNK